jgi:hypothetical protein
MFNEANFDDGMMYECRQALYRIDENSQQENHQKYIIDVSKKFNKNRYMFDEFDSNIFETKIHIDMLFYDKLFSSLTEDQFKQIEGLLGQLYKNVGEIYEFINIKPEFYSNIDVTILDKPMVEAKEIVGNYIYEYLDKQFYTITPKQRYEKYFVACKGQVRSLIEEGVDSEDAIIHTVKAYLMEQFIKNITFPFAIYTHIKETMENEEYGLIFDQEKLIDLVENFETKIHQISRIIAECV